MRILKLVAAAVFTLFLVEPAHSASIFLSASDCGSQCQGTTLALEVIDNGGSFDVTLTINADGYSVPPSTRLGFNQVGFGAIQNWASVSLDSAPNASWVVDPLPANISSAGLCANGDNTGKVCTSGFVDITGGGDFKWEFTVTGGTLQPLSDWHIGAQFADSAAAIRGQIISAGPGGPNVPEPSAALIFGVGVILAARRTRL
jgi:hypothetical protein